MTTIVLAVAVALLGALCAWLAGRLWRARATGPKAVVQSSILSLRDIGQLSVFKVVTKEIVTAEDHAWGEVGRKYLNWLLSTKKMAIIFEFDIDFRYDLRAEGFAIEEQAPGRFIVRVPPCFYEVRVRDLRIYDERKSRFFPLLLPDLLNDFLGGTFSESDKNQLIAEARRHAEAQARSMIGNLESEVQSSARATLASISRAFGAADVTFDFLKKETRDISVSVSEKVRLA